jgi:anti-sigma regulatory factor (Ser/Thr protein kinase)
MEFSRTLSVSTAAGFLARQAVGAFGGDVPSSVLEDARLVVTELISNIVRHTGLYDPQTIELRGSLMPRRLRLELHYDAPPFRPRIRRPDLHSEAGRGLYIVDRLTSRWGIGPNDGAVAWAEWDLEPATDRRSESWAS